jgi:hypothetical protein
MGVSQAAGHTEAPFDDTNENPSQWTLHRLAGHSVLRCAYRSPPEAHEGRRLVFYVDDTFAAVSADTDGNLLLRADLGARFRRRLQSAVGYVRAQITVGLLQQQPRGHP